ncbi:MAG: hypothetical protein RL885_26960 [Planctomycetota bacterium]
MSLSAILLLATFATFPQDDVSSHLPPECRQFDFWVGEWEIENRFLQPGGEYRTDGSANARITPVLGGAAVFEQWRGEIHGRSQIGFSLRAYDPAAKIWNLLLFWPGANGIGQFGTLKGQFRHGRGEFFSEYPGQNGQIVKNRYTFSDALPESMRWDSATSKDGGQTWQTSWIMEFSRTAPASSRKQAMILDPWMKDDVPAPELMTQSAFWLGDWSGKEQVLGKEGWQERTLSSKRSALLAGTLHIGFVDSKGPNGELERRLLAGAYVVPQKQWEWWSFDDRTMQFSNVGGQWLGKSLTAQTRRPIGEPRRTTWTKESDDAYHVEVSRQTESGSWEVFRKQDWTRD